MKSAAEDRGSASKVGKSEARKLAEHLSPAPIRTGAAPAHLLEIERRPRGEEVKKGRKALVADPEGDGEGSAGGRVAQITEDAGRKVDVCGGRRRQRRRLARGDRAGTHATSGDGRARRKQKATAHRRLSPGPPWLPTRMDAPAATFEGMSLSMLEVTRLSR